MDIEDKKFLAEWMGWHTDEENPLHFWVWHESFKETVSTYKIAEWNPDTNPEQFKEVLKRLTGLQKIQLDEKLIDNYDDWDNYNVYLWISEHMPEIIQASIEVLKKPEINS